MLLKTYLALTLLACAGCASSTSQSTSVSIDVPEPDPLIAHASAVRAIYADAKRRDREPLLAKFADRGGSPSATRPALALALLTVEGRPYEQAFIDEYPSDETGVNVDYGELLAASGLFSDGTLHPIRSLAKLAVGNATARRALLAALVKSRGSLGTPYASAAGHVLRTVPASAALASLAQLPDPIRIATISEVDWCARRPDALLNYRTNAVAGVTSPADASIALVQRGISQAVDGCSHTTAAKRRQAERGHGTVPREAN